MDSTQSVGEVADVLGVPQPRVLAWCRQGIIDAHKDGRGRWRLSLAVCSQLMARFGSVPHPAPPQHTRNELLVLAALVRAPRGLPSARAVAARTATSPTTASKALRKLEDAGLCHQTTEPRLWRGRAVEQAVWYPNLISDETERLLTYLHRITLPEPPPSTNTKLPDHLWHLVWNADPASIDVDRDADYLAHRAITLADPEAIAWAISRLPAKAFDRAVTMRGVKPDSVVWARAARGATDAAA